MHIEDKGKIGKVDRMFNFLKGTFFGKKKVTKEIKGEVMKTVSLIHGSVYCRSETK